MGRKTLNITTDNWTDSYDITLTIQETCAKIVNGQNLVQNLTLANVTTDLIAFEIDFGSCNIDLVALIEVTDAAGCQKVLTYPIINPFKIICNDSDDFGLTFGHQTNENDWVEYTATPTGTYNDPVSVVSDVIKYSTDGGSTWSNGSVIERYKCFVTFAKIVAQCNAIGNSAGYPDTYITFNISTGHPDGTGLNFNGTASLMEINIAGTSDYPNFLPMGSGGIINFIKIGSNIGQVDEWISDGVATLELDLEFDDGYLFEASQDFVCPYATNTDVATCDGVLTNPETYIRAGNQRDFLFRRTITFNNGCPAITKTYQMDCVDIVNDQTVPFIEGTLI